jgi:ATP-dependent RNA helicase DDX47/RRP3
LQRAALQSPIQVFHPKLVVSALLRRYFLPHKHQDLYLIHFLNSNFSHLVIMFTRAVIKTQHTVVLHTLGSIAIALYGQLSQSTRLGARFKSKAKI